MKKLISLVKSSKKFRIMLVAAALIIMFFVCGSVIASQYADISRLKKQEEAYSAQLEAQQKENTELEQILDSDDRDAYIEQKAREKGYVKSGETVYYDIVGSN